MQDDRALTFGQIHGHKEALLSAVEDIERIALVESYEVGPLCLRFLEPYPQGGSEFDYILTPAREIQLTDLWSYKYTAVSYVWAHSQPIDETEAPTYRIWDGAALCKPPRQLRCPTIVFHRVVEFSQTRQLARIWIDQECIDQDDPIDVEKHLQVMHRIYGFSCVTAVVLSTIMPEAKGLQSYFRSVEDSSKTADAMLRSLTGDPWFTRSW